MRTCEIQVSQRYGQVSYQTLLQTVLSSLHRQILLFPYLLARFWPPFQRSLLFVCLKFSLDKQRSHQRLQLSNRNRSNPTTAFS